MRKLLITATLFFTSLVALGVATQPDAGPATEPSSAGGRSDVPHEQLQQDAEMTQRMSTPNANGPMQRGQVRDDQLVRSQDPGYVRALEQHQAGVDRMLARPGR